MAGNGGYSSSGTAGIVTPAGPGGAFGGGTPGTGYTGNGIVPIANSGAGGGSGNSGGVYGSSGGAGEFVIFYINNPTTTYTYTVGAGGGGFLMFYTEDKIRLRRAMHGAGLREVRIRFDFEGISIMVHS